MRDEIRAKGNQHSPKGKSFFGAILGAKKDVVRSTRESGYLYVKKPLLESGGCCSIMKKSPVAKYKRRTHFVPYFGTTTDESRLRQQAWLRHGCNAFDSKTPSSQPLSFWTEQDILKYIKEYNVKICSVYGEIAEDENGKLQCTGCQRTGCIFCGFGVHLEKGETRFQRLAKTHPRQYEYALGGGQWIDNPDYDEFLPEYTDKWKNWNPKQIWIPSKEGLGLKKVFDIGNEIYGKQMWRYE